MAKRAATGFAVLCFGKPRGQQEQEQQPLQQSGSAEEVDAANIEPVAEERTREIIATHDQANQTDDCETTHSRLSSAISSTVALRPPSSDHMLSKGRYAYDVHKIF